jgi:hypothetical protein
MLIREILIDGGSVESDGKSTRSSVRTRDFFLFGVVNSRSYSWRMMIQRENFPLIWRRLKR